MPESHRHNIEVVYIRQTMSARVITNICHLAARHIEPCTYVKNYVEDVKPTIITALYLLGYKYKSEMVLY